jgi:peptidoglycan/LPS O-acetylase OafA/YrhL
MGWGGQYRTKVVNALRRVLNIQAAVWAVAGLALLIAPRFVVVTVFDQPPHQELAWLRLFGVQALGLAMLMVLVAHRVKELWWWSWAFAFVSVAGAAVALLNAAFGLGPHQSAALWWVLAAVMVLFSLGLLYGLLAASREQPFP